MDVEIPLIIKASDQQFDDVKIQCNPEWTVLDLKNHLSVHYPSKPRINDQKIIYSGRYLSDDQLMRNIIQLSSSTQSVHTFHLVCMQKSKNNNQKNHTIKNQSSAIGNNLMSSRNQSQSSPSSIDGSPETSAMNSNLASIAAASAATGWNPLNNILFDPDNLMIQQSYQILLQQYYQFIIPYLLVSPPIDFASYTAYNHAYLQSLQDNNNLFWQSNLNSQSNNNNGQNTQQNNNGGAAPEPAIAPMDRNVLENHDELIHRDWVDWMYAFSKVIILFSIFYFYSSFNRMILFVLVFITSLFTSLIPDTVPVN
ncbi:hypothetical protein QR98_0024320 [Sarcoptes scabiei]|uniref:Uncharacterized protein n=2 Tax=Sarcoptes scabiei TaxID=52283 RepID=A0A131ZZ93_SARSC|nr:hypothetical protein QR98_0024320 [Sarcoptes scabiei]